MSDKTVKSNNTLIVKGQSDDLLIPKSPQDQLAFFEMIAKSGNAGVRNAGDALVLVSMAKELNIGIATALRNINIISTQNGTKMEVSYHIIKAQLDRFSHIVNYERTKDYGPVYGYISSSSITFMEQELPNNAIIVPMPQLKSKPPDGKFHVAMIPEIKNGKPTGKGQIFDYSVEYTFKRRIPDIEDPGQIKIKKHIEKFYYSMAQKRGLVKEKGAWIKMPEIMCDKSCFVAGSRFIASDIILNLTIPEEMGVEFTTNDDTAQVVVEEQ